MGRTRQWLGSRVHNHLSLLLRRGEIRRFSLGRTAVYSSADPARHNRPRASRQPPPEPVPGPPAQGARPVCPARHGGHGPDPAAACDLSKAHRPAPPLARQVPPGPGLAIPADRVRQVMAFYSTKKKRHPEGRLPPASLPRSLAGFLGSRADANGLCHRFDEPAEEGTRVQKTTSRKVVTLGVSAFRTVEVVRATSGHQCLALAPSHRSGPQGRQVRLRPDRLRRPPTFLQGRNSDVATELPTAGRSLQQPPRSFHEVPLLPRPLAPPVRGPASAGVVPATRAHHVAYRCHGRAGHAHVLRPPRCGQPHLPGRLEDRQRKRQRSGPLPSRRRRAIRELPARCSTIWATPWRPPATRPGTVPCRTACASSTCSATSARTCTRGPRRRSGNLSAS